MPLTPAFYQIFLMPTNINVTMLQFCNHAETFLQGCNYLKILLSCFLSSIVYSYVIFINFVIHFIIKTWASLCIMLSSALPKAAASSSAYFELMVINCLWMCRAEGWNAGSQRLILVVTFECAKTSYLLCSNDYSLTPIYHLMSS